LTLTRQCNHCTALKADANVPARRTGGSSGEALILRAETKGNPQILARLPTVA
jgi:hypothetical protein